MDVSHQHPLWTFMIHMLRQTENFKRDKKSQSSRTPEMILSTPKLIDSTMMATTWLEVKSQEGLITAQQMIERSIERSIEHRWDCGTEESESSFVILMIRF